MKLFNLIFGAAIGCGEPLSDTSLEEKVCSSNFDAFELIYNKVSSGTYDYYCNSNPESPFVFTDPLIGDVYHKLFKAVSYDDGSTWEEEEIMNLYASVPEVLISGQEHYLLTCGNCPLWASDDGINYEPQDFTLTNISDENPCPARVDPTGFVSSDKINFAFFAPNMEKMEEENIDPAHQEGPHDIVEYRSKDMETFSLEDILFSKDSITDPTMILGYNGKDYIYSTWMGNKIIGYSRNSNTEDAYQPMNNGDPLIDFFAVTDVIAKSNGGLLMVGHRFDSKSEQSILTKYESSDGENWQPSGDIFSGESPTLTYFGDRLEMVYVKKEPVEESVE